MKTQLFHFFRTFPLFGWLLPVFFVLHGYVEFYDLIPIKDSIILILKYLLATAVLIGLSWLFYKNIYKASILAFALLAYNFFFGPVHDWVKQNFPGMLFTRYIFILPVTLVLFLVLIIFLKKRKKPFFNLTNYLNLLLIILLVADVASLISKTSQKKDTGYIKDEFINCKNCSKPDIYFILTDEYAGKRQLTELFKFDNTAFVNELRKRGFHIIDSTRSNYNYTVFSAPSILNMDYIPGIERRNQSLHDRKICMNMMEDNAVFRFFKKQGYRTYNYSPFYIADHPYLAKPSFLPRHTSQLVAQTFLFRLEKDLWFHLVTDLRLPGLKEMVIYNDKKNNELFIRRTKEISAKQIDQPKFVYTHLIMPHYPYYYDKDGNETPYENLDGQKTSAKELYLGYLQYSNKVFLELIDTIKRSSPKPSIIMLMSDHGFKSFPNYAHAEYHFDTFTSLMLPDSNYSPFYNGISNVNQFRVLLNSRFDQRLPLLKDSTIFITE